MVTDDAHVCHWGCRRALSKYLWRYSLKTRFQNTKSAKIAKIAATKTAYTNFNASVQYRKTSGLRRRRRLRWSHFFINCCSYFSNVEKSFPDKISSFYHQFPHPLNIPPPPPSPSPLFYYNGQDLNSLVLQCSLKSITWISYSII